MAYVDGRPGTSMGIPHRPDAQIGFVYADPLIHTYLEYCCNMTPNPYKDWSRPVTNWLRPEPVKTGLVTVKDRRRPVCCGSVRFFGVSRIGRTGYGYGLRHWAPKDRTGPDFQTLLSLASADSQNAWTTSVQYLRAQGALISVT